MRTFIAGISALQLLNFNGSPQRRALSRAGQSSLVPTRMKPKPGQAPDVSIIKDLGYPDGILTEKLHVNVAAKQYRSQSKEIISHIWTGPDRGTYLRVDDHYCVSSPEAVFAQMAKEISLVHLVELGMFLCGTYALDIEGMPTRYNLEPLTTTKKLATYINRLSSQSGIKKARSAIIYVQDGSASPMESKIATALALPTRHGGYGIPAQLNVELELTDKARGRGYHKVRKPDFLWPNQHLSMDYDSREYHELAGQPEADESRRNELSALGINCIVARNKDFRDQLAFEQLMEQLRSAMGKTAISKAKGLPDKRAALYQQLFGSRQWNPMDQR